MDEREKGLALRRFFPLHEIQTFSLRRRVKVKKLGTNAVRQRLRRDERERERDACKSEIFSREICVVDCAREEEEKKKKKEMK